MYVGTASGGLAGERLEGERGPSCASMLGEEDWEAGRGGSASMGLASGGCHCGAQSSQASLVHSYICNACWVPGLGLGTRETIQGE